jgi:hypothetical protein
MDDRDCLAHFAFVVVRIACRVCSRRGSYRLARLAAKFGPEISLRDLTERFSYDCLWRAEARSKKGKSACGVYLPDLENPRPPDLPPRLLKLRLIKSGLTPTAQKKVPAPDAFRRGASSAPRAGGQELSAPSVNINTTGVLSK